MSPIIPRSLPQTAVVTDWTMCVSSPSAAGFTAACCRHFKQQTMDQMFWGTCSVTGALKYVSALSLYNIRLFRSMKSVGLELIFQICDKKKKLNKNEAPCGLRAELLRLHNFTSHIVDCRLRAPCPHSESSDASRRCDRPAELVGRLLLLLLRGEDQTVFYRELCDLSGGNLSAVSCRAHSPELFLLIVTITLHELLYCLQCHGNGLLQTSA